MKYSADLTFHPGVFLSESTALYGILGASIAEISTNFKRVSQGGLLPQERSRQNHETDTLYGFVLGAGIQKQLCNRFSMFVSYQYTYYGDHSLRDHQVSVPVIPALRQVSPANFNGVDHRTLNIDTNVFKIGLLYTF